MLGSAAVAAQWSQTRERVRRWADIDRIPRHHAAMTRGIPAPYRMMHNPLRPTVATLARGQAVYRSNCLACHGSTGTGDDAMKPLVTPAPFDLVWLSEMKVSRIDGFLYWSIDEGGAPFATAMPAFKATLSPSDIWAAVTYIQAGIPQRRPHNPRTAPSTAARAPDS